MNNKGKFIEVAKWGWTTQKKLNTKKLFEKALQNIHFWRQKGL